VIDVIQNTFIALLGLLFVLMGIFGREFYWAKSLDAIFPSDKRAPTWAGRFVFLFLGIMALIYSIKQMIWGTPDP
jgi:hypothetical protein